MASKQVVSNIKNAELARNTEPTFGHDSEADPWRNSPALAAQRQMFNYGNFGHGKDYGDNTAAYADRYGTAGGSNEATPGYPTSPESTQRQQGIKGAETGTYRVVIGQVVQ